MARKCGHGCSYGYGHHDEHVDAAKLGWKTRRYGEAKYVGKAFAGYSVHAHEGTGLGRFKKYIVQHDTDGDTFELTQDEYRDVLSKIRSSERSKFLQESLFSRETRAKQRAVDAQHHKNAVEQRRAEREEQRYHKLREREDEYERRRSAVFERDMLYHAVKEHAPHGIKRYQGKRESEEYQAVPRQFRSRSGDGIAPDDLAAHLSENAPWLNIHSDNDLLAAFGRIDLARNNERERRRRAS